VKTAHFFTQADDGLAKDWHGRVFLNPPYSKTDGKSNQELWAKKLISEQGVTEAVLMVKAAFGYQWFERLFSKYP
jgi:hypothetical protein